MKFKTALIIASVIAVFLNETLIAQSDWVWQNPLPQGNNLNDVTFVNSQLGFAVGNRGAVVRTTDGGIRWEPQQTNILQDLNKVFFLDEANGIIVGKYGSILRTFNGGKEWSIQASGVNSDLYCVYMLDRDNVVVGGSCLVLRTTDAGATWNIFTSWSQAPKVRDICFTSRNNGIAVGSTFDIRIPEYYGYIYRTTDGGASWTECNIGQDNGLRTVEFVDEMNGYACGKYGLVYRTTDGGVTWEKQAKWTSQHLEGLRFFDAANGMMIGSTLSYTATPPRKFWHTTDAGHTWYCNDIDSMQQWSGIYFQNHFRHTRVGAWGMISQTEDGGVQWAERKTGPTDYLIGLYFVTPNVGTVAGENGRILRTTDAGKTWIPQQSGTVHTLYDVFFWNTEDGIISGAYGTLLRTTDGGTTWIPQYTGTTTSHLYRICKTVRRGTIILGTENLLLETIDNGKTWGHRSINTTSTMRDIGFFDSDNGIILCSDSTWFRTTDGGSTWVSQPRIDNGKYNFIRHCALHIINTNSAIVTTTFGSFRTDDKGNHWSNAYPGNGVVAFMSSDTGKMVWYTNIYNTIDGGHTWELEYVSDTELWALQYVGDRTWVSVGPNGAILRSTTGGVTWVEDDPVLPVQIHLAQNYPNPFSSSTSIPIALETPEFVSLRVYSMLGEEVAVLKEERMEAGAHTATWNPQGLPAGMYFYVLRAGSATVTKTMVLLNK